MGESGKGVLAMIAACVIWGLSPLYYKLLADVPPLEVLSHRTLWSLAFFGLVLLVRRRLGEVFVLLRRARGLALVTLAAVMISANWFFYIWAIQIGRTVEASLGYYMFPLVAVMLGVVAFAERLSRWRKLAVAMAALAVVLLSWGLGAAPWISLILAGTFGLYGLLKKQSGAGPVVSVSAEVLVLAPLAVVWLWGVHAAGWTGMAGREGEGAVFLRDAAGSLLLVFSGPMTAGPLILFSYASRRITMATLGLVQYLNPTLQFLCAVVIFGEPFTGWHGLAFALIWAALAIYSADAFRQEKAARRAKTRESASFTNVM